ncbi:NAD-dependent epimerase/dehydratase family protein, partial [Candidatus Parcubacteria bacterium]|nr:NAD-dependent epimerase/dehydratase family protein [Candidatus Parcubacteria bacterium]
AIKRRASSTRRIQDLIKNKAVKTFNIDKKTLENLFLKNKIDFIIHTATSYGRANENSKYIKQANFVLPFELLKFGIKHNSKAFINSDTFLNKQNDQSVKNYNYITTKKKFLRIAKKKIKKSDIKFVNLIIEHMYGPDDNPTKIIPFFIKKLLQNQKKIALNTGEQKRDFIYVDDVCRAFLKSINHLNNLKQFEEFGIGTGQAITFKNLINKIKKRAESQTILGWKECLTDKRDCAYSQADLLNNKKIGWKPTFSLNQGIIKTVKYYKKTNH